jgi:hypothetical protein
MPLLHSKINPNEPPKKALKTHWTIIGNPLQCRSDMKNSLFTTVLSWLLATSVILSVVFCIQFGFRTRDLRLFQAQIGRYQTTHQILNVLLNDLAAYSRQDPGITPILQSLGIRVTTNNPTAAAAAKTPAK